MFMAPWRGYTHFILDRTKYVEDEVEGLNREQIRLGMIDKADHGEFSSFLLAHGTGNCLCILIIYLPAKKNKKNKLN